MSLKWDFVEVADALGRAVHAVEAELRLEQAVYGIDARDERAIQAMLAEQLAVNAFEVAREAHYPSSIGKKLTHRMRCDLVLAPKGKPLRSEVLADAPTLFDPPSTPMCDPADALWLEVKVAYQFREGGVRHGGYGSQWRQAVVADLKKMEAEPLIHEAGLVLVVFNESQAILDKDLELFEDILVRKEVLAGFRQVRSVPIVERIGHRLCSIAIWPTIQRSLTTESR